jgi:hypothetical protein
MARTCNYENRPRLDEAVLQVFQNNLRDFCTREKLMPVTDLTHRALRIAMTNEAIYAQLDGVKPREHAAAARTSQASGEVHAVYRNMHTPGGDWSPFWRCCSYHNAANCAVNYYQCYACGRIGHITRMYLSSRPLQQVFIITSRERKVNDSVCSSYTSSPRGEGISARHLAAVNAA